MSTTPAHPLVGRGILAVWNNRDATIAAEYERWYVGEHLPERVGVDGFHWGRRYEAVTDTAARRFFTYYQTDDPAVLASPAYRARLAAPSPWTGRIMAHWRDMVRVVARRRHHAGGAFVSAHVAVARFDTGPPPWAALTAAVDDVAGDDAVLAAELWEAVSDDGATVEAGLRDGPDAGAAGAALIHGVDAMAVTRAAEKLAALASADLTTYRFLSGLESQR